MSRMLTAHGARRSMTGTCARAERTRILVDRELAGVLRSIQCWLDAAVQVTGDDEDKSSSEDLFTDLAAAIGLDPDDPTLLRVAALNQPVITRVVTDRYGLQRGMFYFTGEGMRSGWSGVRVNAADGNRALSLLR